MPARSIKVHFYCVSMLWGGIALAAIVYFWSGDDASRRHPQDPQVMATVVNAAPSERAKPVNDLGRENQQQEILGLRQRIKDLETDLITLRRQNHVPSR